MIINHLLATRRFLPLFMTQFLGTFNANSFKNALIMLLTYRVTQIAGLNSQILITLAAGIFILPFFLFSATAGELADKYEKSRLISIIKFFEMILMVLAALGFYFHSLFLLMVVLFLMGTQSTFFGPLKYAILPDNLHPNELLSGNGLIEAGTFLAILFGTIIGGVVVLFPSGDKSISLITFSAALIGFMFSLFIPKTKSHHPTVKIHFNFIAETLRIINYARNRSEIFLCIVAISWFWLIGATFLAEFPAFTKNDLHANEHVVTFFFALFSIGIALGSLVCNKLLKGQAHAHYVPYGALGMTVFAVDLYFAAGQMSLHATSELLNLSVFFHTFFGIRIAIDLLMIAVCGGIYTVPLYTLLQMNCDAEYRARVIAANNVMNALFMVLAAVFTMVLLKLNLTVRDVFLVVSLGNIFVALAVAKKAKLLAIRDASV